MTSRPPPLDGCFDPGDWIKCLVDHHFLNGCFGQVLQKVQRLLVHLPWMDVLIKSYGEIKNLIDHHSLDGCFD